MRYVVGKIRSQSHGESRGVPSPVPVNQPRSLSTPTTPLRHANSSLAASFVGAAASLGIATPGKWSEE